MSSLARHLTLIVPLSIHPGVKMGTGHHLGGVEYPESLHETETGISSGLIAVLYAELNLPFIFPHKSTADQNFRNFLMSINLCCHNFLQQKIPYMLPF